MNGGSVAADGSACGDRSERRDWPRRWPRNVLAAWACAGLGSGFLLGVVGGGLIGMVAIFSEGLTSYSAYEALLAILVAVVVGSVTGLIVGILNGVVIGLLSRVFALCSHVAVRHNLVSATAAVMTGLSGFAVLDHVFGGVNYLVYLSTGAGTLLVIFLSRRLPPIRDGSALAS
jgi:hypothetical protein